MSGWIYTLYFPECQQTSWSKHTWYRKFKSLQRGTNSESLSSQKNAQPFGLNVFFLKKGLSCAVSIYLYGAFDCILLLLTNNFVSESTLHSCLNVKGLLPWNRGNIWRLNDCNVTRINNHLVRKWTLSRLAKPGFLKNDWDVLRALICTMHLTVCFYHVTCMFQSESTLYSFLNV